MRGSSLTWRQDHIVTLRAEAPQPSASFYDQRMLCMPSNVCGTLRIVLRPKHCVTGHPNAFACRQVQGLIA